MQEQNLNQLIVQLETYLECWKQLNTFIALARTKKFTPDDESQFLEVKSILVQDLESIMAHIECSSPTRDEILALISGIPSIRHMSESTDNTLRNIETQWHKIFLAWQSILGQLKVRQQDVKPQSFLTSFFKKKNN
jgi:hypothetical protein